jgi:hypothetical protein
VERNFCRAKSSITVSSRSTFSFEPFSTDACIYIRNPFSVACFQGVEGRRRVFFASSGFEDEPFGHAARQTHPRYGAGAVDRTFGRGGANAWEKWTMG